MSDDLFWRPGALCPEVVPSRPRPGPVGLHTRAQAHEADVPSRVYTDEMLHPMPGAGAGGPSRSAFMSGFLRRDGGIVRGPAQTVRERAVQDTAYLSRPAPRVGDPGGIGVLHADDRAGGGQEARNKHLLGPSRPTRQALGTTRRFVGQTVEGWSQGRVRDAPLKQLPPRLLSRVSRRV